MIMSRTRPVMRMTSQVATRPLPSTVGTRRWETTPLSVEAIIARTWPCMWGGKKSIRRLTVSARVDGVDRREHEVAGLRRAEGRVDGLLVAHLADEDHVGVLAQDAAQGLLEGAGVHAHLALVDDRLLVDVQELHRVLDRHDVTAARSC